MTESQRDIEKDRDGERQKQRKTEAKTERQMERWGWRQGRGREGHPEPRAPFVETERTTCGELGPCGGFGEEEENFLTAGPAQLLKARGVLWQDGLAVPWGRVPDDLRWAFADGRTGKGHGTW
jgi:hypothetical protein